MKQITVAGAGYVGLSIATLLAQQNKITLIDVIQEKVDKINNRISPLQDEYIELYFNSKQLDLTATCDTNAYKDAEFIIIAVPTNYNEVTNYFDCHFIEDVIDTALPLNPDVTFVIKSTIPVGYCETLYKKYEGINLMFSPEFLRESKALYDNLYPSRIIVGSPYKLRSKAKAFAELLKDAALKEDIDILYMGTTEAEAVKLFANTYLALRVSYFNELDTYASICKLNTESIIKGISLDPRIGDYYNNPSFGYGGYCLPKDTKQLLANYKNIPQNIISAIVESNKTRKHFIVDQILSKKPKIVGIYRLIMKSGSDNFRAAAIQDIIELLKQNNINVIIYEPTADTELYPDLVFNNDFNDFKTNSDIIVANRYSSELDDVKHKVYTKDIFNNN